MNSNSDNWKSCKFRLATTEQVETSQISIAGDDLSIIFSNPIGAHIQNGDGPMAESASFLLTAEVMHESVSIDQIERIDIVVSLGINRRGGTEGALIVHAMGEQLANVLAFGQQQEVTLENVRFSVSNEQIARSQFPYVRMFFTIFGQRESPDDFITFEIDGIDVRLWRR